MELKYWIYLIIAIVYIISRALKKKENPPKEAQDYKPERQVRYDPTPPAEKPKQLTFEELLKEITEAKNPQKPVYQQSKYETIQPKTEYIDYDDQVGEEEQDLEDTNYDYRKKDKLYEVYDEAKRQAFERPSLEETMKLADTQMKFGKFKAFEQEEKRNLLEEYTKDLRDPEGLKKAFVLSEILNRKF